MKNVVLRGRRPGLLAVLWSSLGLVLADPAASAGIEHVASYDPLSRPQQAFRGAPDGSGVLLTLSSGEPGTRSQISAKVTAETGRGEPLAVVKQSDTTYLIRMPAKSFALVHLASDVPAGAPASVPKMLGGVTGIYSGTDLNDAVQTLRNRLDRLPSPPEGDGLMAVQQRDMRAWLHHRLGTVEPQAEAMAAGQLPTGSMVAEMTYAAGLLDLLARDRDTIAAARGRQLPARRVFEVHGGGEVREVAFDFVLRLPTGMTSETWPLLLIVHGATQNPSIQGGRRDEIEEAAAQTDFPFMTVAPIVNREMRRGGWDPGELAALVESLCAQYPVDRDRVYISGFSAGGYATVSTVVRRPDLFAAYAPLCGSGDPAWAPALAPLPVYLYHGDADPTNPCYSSVVFYQALEAAGGHPNLRVYEKMGHLVWTEVYRDVEFYQRLLQHRRIPLVGVPLPDIGHAGEVERLDLSDAPPTPETQVCWVDESLKLGDLWSDANTLRQLQRKLMLLYPRVPLTGGVLLYCPDGWTDASSPVSVGIAVQGQAPAPDGFIFRPLQASGRLTAIYHGAFQLDDVAAATRRFQTVRQAESDTGGAGLLIELEGAGWRGRSRAIIRAID